MSPHMQAQVTIDGKPVGPDHRVYVIAEAGVNHNGDIGMARELIHAAQAAGADAVKFQLFKADRLASSTAPTCDYQRTAAADSTTRSQRDLLRRLELSAEAFAELKAEAARRGIAFMATPFG